MTHHETYPDLHHDLYTRTIFGFWIYLMTDFIMFATLFAVYLVLQHSTFGAPSGKDLFDLPYTLTQTLLLLTSTFTVGIAGAMAHRRHKQGTISFFLITLLLGVAFTDMQFLELYDYCTAGHGWQRSGYLSAFYTLVGTFALHIVIGLIWIVALIIPVCRNGIQHTDIRRLTCLRMFWQFLNIVWLFIFSVVYLGSFTS